MDIRLTARERGPAAWTGSPVAPGSPHVGIVVTAGAVCAVLALACRLAQELWGVFGGGVIEEVAPVAGTALYAVQILLAPLAVVGLYVYQQADFGRFGEAAFVTALLGTVAWAAGAAHGVLDVEANGGHTRDVISTGELVAVFVGFGLGAIGLVLFGIATWRARVLPRVPVVLLVAGIPLGVALQAVVPGILVVYSAGLAWLSIAAVLRQHAAEQPRSESTDFVKRR